MFEKELAEYMNNPQVNRLCMVMDIVQDHFKDYNSYVKEKVDSSLRNFNKAILDRLNLEVDNNNYTFNHQDLIDMFYKSMRLQQEVLRKSGNKVYFVDFVGMFNISIFEDATFFITFDDRFKPSVRKETVTDLFGKKIAEFMYQYGEGAHIFKFKQDCDIFCYFVTILNTNLLNK